MLIVDEFIMGKSSINFMHLSLQRIKFLSPVLAIIIILLTARNHQAMAFSTESPQTKFLPLEGTPYNNPMLYNSYEESMHEVLEHFRVMQKKDKSEDMAAARRYLFSPHRYADVAPAPGDNEEFQEYVSSQSENFLNKAGLDKNQKQLALRALTYIGDHCAKKRTSAPLHVAWDKIKEMGVSPRENALSAYLYIFSSLPLESDSDASLEIASVVGETEQEAELTKLYNPNDVSGEVALYHDMFYKPTENTVSIRIKSLVAQGNAEEAEKLLWDLESSATAANTQKGGKKKKKNDNEMLKLRTCVPVLQLYCEEGNVSDGMKLYQKMRNAPSVYFEPETYVLILSSLARRGYFCSDAEAIEDVQEFGYKAGKGAELFDAIVSEMADDVLEITSTSAKEIRNGLVAGFKAAESARNLYEVPYDCDLVSISDEASEDELIANRVSIENDTTTCPRSKAALRLILLGDAQRNHVHDTLLEMADTQYEAYAAKMQKKGSNPPKNALEENYAGKHLQGFANWLNNREGKPFTAIVDGANVAYYGLGSINYHQVQLMVNALEKMGETPLVIIPQKYTQRKFYLRQGYVQELPQIQMDILEDLDKSGKLYTVPHRCLDDYYWMLSSVSNQKQSKGSTNLDVDTDNEEGRWPGTRPMLLTNDQMRDHKLELLEPRLFRRWVSSHIVNYHFPPFLNNAAEEREITFTPADCISREIQGNLSNNNGLNDQNAMAWHFPVKDWDNADRFCVRIPKL